MRCFLLSKDDFRWIVLLPAMFVLQIYSFWLLPAQHHQLNAKTILLAQEYIKLNLEIQVDSECNASWVSEEWEEADEFSTCKIRHRLQRQRGEDLSPRLITPLIACQVLTQQYPAPSPPHALQPPPSCR